MSRITEYTSVSAFDENDVLIKDGENGTKIISVEDAAAEFRRLCGINGDISNITDSLSAFGTNLAGVETTFIATKNYNIGDLFVIDNVLYRATATIASGSEIDPETNCEETSFSTVIEAMNDILANKANVDGSYSTLTAGNAEQLVGTIFTEDDAAYTFRTAGGSADIGDREYDEIVGGSIVWNQYSPTNKSQFAVFNTANCVIENGVARVWGTWGSSNGDEFRISMGNIPVPSNHVLFCDTGLTDDMLRCRIQGKASASRKNNTILKVATTDSAVYDLVIGVYVDKDTEIDITFKPQLFDLTQMFGSEIADYIYNLEQTTPGAGVAWFRKYFPKDYYEYNPGEIMSVEGLTSHDMVGFNLWDEEWENGAYSTQDGTAIINSNRIRSKNLIPVVPNSTYYVSAPSSYGDINVHYFDSDKKFISCAYNKRESTFVTPSNCHYILWNNVTNNVTTYNHDICINLSWDGERDGEYEPYVKHSYPLDSSLTLRGIPKLSTDGKLYYDGDHYKSDGTVERRYGIVDLGTLDWDRIANPFPSLSETYLFVNIGQTIDGNAIADYSEKRITPLYKNVIVYTHFDNDKSIGYIYEKRIAIRDDSYTDAASFKAAMSGVYLVYELAEPTTEEAQPFQSPQIVDDFGTEEYVTSSIVPVGHITQYDSNLRAKLEMAPNSPDGDGDYLVRQTSGQNEYVPYTDGGRITALEGKIPTPPSTDGTYVLKCTVADGTPTYSWVSA